MQSKVFLLLLEGVIRLYLHLITLLLKVIYPTLSVTTSLQEASCGCCIWCVESTRLQIQLGGQVRILRRQLLGYCVLPDLIIICV